VLIVDFIATLSTGMRFRRDVAADEISRSSRPCRCRSRRHLLVRLPARWVLLALGLFILVYAVYSLAYHARPRTHSRWWAIPTGLAGGVISGLCGMGGPVYVVYLAGRVVDPARLRASLSAVFSINTAARLGLFLFSGLLLQTQVWLAALYLLPFMALGLFAGHRIHLKLTRGQIAKLLSLLLLATGISVLWKAFAAA
jgi:uncharacterized membrane protein YfcA